ncbi:MAG: AMP-binding protein, partial [Acidobacteria bacterium]|nr:AMP-binding protein [Acidobacteriota bacterium]
MAKNEDEAAVYENGHVISRKQILSLALDISRSLRDEGVRPGQTVAVQMRNSTSLLATFAAAFHLGTTILPIDRDARQAERDVVLAQFPVRALVRRDESGQIVIELIEADLPAMPGEPVALIKLTSGSTGRPRGVLTSGENLIADCRSICATMGIAPEDVNLGAIPFSHSYGFSNIVTPLLLQGTRVVISNDYIPLPILELSNRHRVTVLPGIPMMYDHLSRLPAEDGTFLLPLRAAGTYVLRARRLSYPVTTSERLEVALRDTVVVDIRMSQEPLQIDPVVVTAHRRAAEVRALRDAG